MEIEKDLNLTRFKINDYENNQIIVGNTVFTSSFFVSNNDAPINWEVTNFDNLTTEHLLNLVKNTPDLMIIGTGSKWQIPSPKITAPILAKHIGIEFMDNKHACQSYNMIAGDGRKVVLAIIM